MSFLQTVGDAVKNAAKTVSESTKAAYANARAAPTEVTCSGGECGRQVVVPAETFAWRCQNCQNNNGRDDAKCTNGACSQARQSGLKYWVKCTACGTVTEVPFSRAAQAFKNTGRNVKAVVASAADATKRNYEYLKGHAAEFHCTTCNARLKNPNPPPLSPEELKERAGEGPDGAAAPAAEPARIEKVECPVCHKVTSVPESNFGSKVAATGQSIKKGSTKAWMTVSRKKFSPCPVCEEPVEVPADQLPGAGAAPAAEEKAPEASATAPGEAPPAAAAAAAAAPADGSGQREYQVNLSCPKCDTNFPAKVIA